MTGGVRHGTEPHRPRIRDPRFLEPADVPAPGVESHRRRRSGAAASRRTGADHACLGSGDGYGRDRRDDRGTGPRRRPRGCPRLQGRSLRRADGRAEPVHAARGAGAVDRRARRPGVRRGGAAEPVPSGRQRELPLPQRVDAGPGRRRPAPGHGLAARRRLQRRLGVVRHLRRRQPVQPERRGRRHHQPPPQHLRVGVPGRAGRRRVRGVRLRGHARHRRRPRVGA